MTFLQDLVAVLVFLGGAIEYIFVTFFARPDVRANFGELLSMLRGSEWRKYNKETVQFQEGPCPPGKDSFRVLDLWTQSLNR